MCSEAVSHAKIWSREGVPSADSVILPLASCSAAQTSVEFLTLCVAAEGFWLKHDTFCDALTEASVLCLAVLFATTVSVLFASLLRGSCLLAIVGMWEVLAFSVIVSGSRRGL